MTEMDSSESSGNDRSLSSDASVSSEANATRSEREKHLIWFLRFVAASTLLAFVAAVMPEKWIVEIAEELSFDPFPNSPLTFYLARHLSLLYGFGGIGLFVMCSDYPRYKPLFPLLAWGTISFGLMQLIADVMAAMPIWWTVGESLSTMGGGGLILWLYRRAEQ